MLDYQNVLYDPDFSCKSWSRLLLPFKRIWSPCRLILTLWNSWCFYTFWKRKYVLSGAWFVWFSCASNHQNKLACKMANQYFVSSEEKAEFMVIIFLYKLKWIQSINNQKKFKIFCCGDIHISVSTSHSLHIYFYKGKFLLEFQLGSGNQQK